MTRDSEERLLAFCAQQLEAFSADQWRAAPGDLGLAREVVAAAAWLLATQTWAGLKREPDRNGLAAAAEALCDQPMMALLRGRRLDAARLHRMLERDLRHPRAEGVPV